MRLDRFVWVAGALSFLLGCSGQYEVGKLSDGGASGMGSGGGAGGFTGVFTGYAGGAVDVSGGSVVGSGGSSPSGTAGAAQVSGVEPYGLSPSFCGNAIPLSHITEFASPELVWTRIQKFLRGEITDPEPAFPASTTREWAAEQAMAVLNSVENSMIDSPYHAAPGLVRAVNQWLPNAQSAPYWASLLGSNASLRTLFTTDDAQPHGAGVLTDPTLLNERNLVVRGRYIAANLVCMNVPAPPVGVPPLPVQPSNETRRQLYAAHTANAVCKACHSRIDPFGIALEHFTPLTGAYTDLDNGFPIDSSSSVVLPTTGELHFADASELGLALADSCEVAQCLTMNLLKYAENSAELPVAASADPAAVAEIAFASYQSGNNLRGLLWYLVQSDTFLRAP